MRKIEKEIDLGHGLFKYVEVEEQSYSEQMQDELEPIAHPTQPDESDEIEEAKIGEGELTEFEKSELKRKIKKRSVWGDAGEVVEWRIVKLEGGGFIRRPFPVKEATLAGPDRPKKPWHFWKDEKWEWKNDT